MKRISSSMSDLQRADGWCDISMRSRMNGSQRCGLKVFMMSRLHRGLHVIADRESCVPEKRCTFIF